MRVLKFLSRHQSKAVGTLREIAGPVTKSRQKKVNHYRTTAVTFGIDAEDHTKVFTQVGLNFPSNLRKKKTKKEIDLHLKLLQVSPNSIPNISRFLPHITTQARAGTPKHPGPEYFIPLYKRRGELIAVVGQPTVLDSFVVSQLPV